MPKNLVKEFLSGKYSDYGSNFFSFLFGKNLGKLVDNSKKKDEIIDLISTSLISIKINLHKNSTKI